MREKTYITRSDTSFVDVIDSKVRVHSRTAASANKTIVDFTLPSNTIKWTYWIGVGDDSQKAFAKDRRTFASAGAKLISSFNPLAGLAFGLITMTHNNIGDNVRYSFLPSYEDVAKYTAGAGYMQFKSGDVVSDFGLMNYSNKENAKYYVGLENDNLMEAIDVTVKVLAVKVESRFKTETERVPLYKNSSGPVIVD